MRFVDRYACRMLGCLVNQDGQVHMEIALTMDMNQTGSADG